MERVEGVERVSAPSVVGMQAEKTQRNRDSRLEAGRKEGKAAGKQAGRHVCPPACLSGCLPATRSSAASQPASSRSSTALQAGSGAGLREARQASGGQRAHLVERSGGPTGWAKLWPRSTRQAPPVRRARETGP